MKLKDVSFVCVVLAIIVAMTFHHILSGDLIEEYSGIKDHTLSVEVTTPPEIEQKNREIEILQNEISSLQSEIYSLQNNYKNSEDIMDQIEEEASQPLEDVPIDEDGSDIVDPDPTPPQELLLPIDDKEHFYGISTCGKMGKDPPNDSDCAKYTWRQTWGNDPSLYDYDKTEGIHHWYVPKTGSYIIEAAGSSGGTIKGAEENDIEVKPGRGAIIRGIFYLKKGDKYNIIIGQKGTIPFDRSNPWNGGAGAGGGTFMWKDKDISKKPLIVAGGGGGQGVFGHKISGFGGDASLIEDGTMGPLVKEHFDIPDPTNIVDNFGKNGDGGGDPSKPAYKSKGWNNILSGKSMVGATNMFKSESGFGGGGIMVAHAGGGGGGYSGGGSKKYGYSESNTMGGGGGGSYFNNEGFKREDSSDEGMDYNEEDGYITIKLIKDYFFVEGNKVKCEEYGGYEPSSIEQCAEASSKLGFEWKRGPRRTGWNNNNCKNNFSKCIWRREGQQINNCGAEKTVKGLIYNDRCKGMDGYGTNGIDNVYKTVCVSPIKALEDKLV